MAGLWKACLHHFYGEWELSSLNRIDPSQFCLTDPASMGETFQIFFSLDNVSSSLGPAPLFHCKCCRQCTNFPKNLSLYLMLTRAFGLTFCFPLYGLQATTIHHLKLLWDKITNGWTNRFHLQLRPPTLI